MQRNNDSPIGRFDKDCTIHLSDWHNISSTAQCHVAQIKNESLMFDLQKMSLQLLT